MKVLWVGDFGTSTGFARVTEACCHALVENGHEVVVLGLGYYGDPIDRPWKSYPCVNPLAGGRDAYGIGRIGAIMFAEQPDVIVVLNDPWNIPAYLDSLEGFANRLAEAGQAPRLPPVVGFLAVDAVNQDGEPLNRLAHVAVWTEWAAGELKRCGYAGSTTVVPLGVDTSVFSPRDRVLSRAVAAPTAEDCFLIGVVGRNQPRKRIDLTLAVFAEFVERYRIDDAKLYIHTAPTGERGCDIRRLVRHYNLHGRVIVNEPAVGCGVAEQEMPLIYSSFDVYLTTTQGEGWGLPALEAMACGVPVVAPRWSGLASWAGEGAVLVPCTETALNAPINGNPYTIGGVVGRSECASALHDLYVSSNHRAACRQRGLRLAEKLPWEATGAGMLGVLERVVSEQAADETAAAESVA